MYGSMIVIIIREKKISNKWQLGRQRTKGTYQVKKATRHSKGRVEGGREATGVLSRRVLKNGEGSVRQQTQNGGKIK
jgi:hypothetical protein